MTYNTTEIERDHKIMTETKIKEIKHSDEVRSKAEINSLKSEIGKVLSLFDQFKLDSFRKAQKRA